MEITRAPRRRRVGVIPAVVALYICIGGFGPLREVCSAQGGCAGTMPPPIPIVDPNYNRGLANYREIPYYIDAGASVDERAQIDAAFLAWQIALAASGRSITFTMTNDQTLAEASGIDVAIGPTSPGDPASFEVISRDPQTSELQAARITIDLRGGPSTSRLYFDPELPGYYGVGALPGAVTKAMMHEVGHSLGIYHFAGRACTEQRSGASVMNGMCGINDHGATLNGVERPPALANRPAPCDVAAVWAVSLLAERVHR